MSKSKTRVKMPITFAAVVVLLVSMIPLTIGQDSLPRDQCLVIPGVGTSWNPLGGGTVGASWNIMYPNLFMYNPNKNEWIPYLAKSYRWLDKITLEVTLRDEAKWWDGTPITGEDVKYSIELGKPGPILPNYTIAMYTQTWTYLEKILVSPLNNNKVLFYVKRDTLNYMQIMLMLHQALVLPKSRWEGLVTEWNTTLTSAFTDDDPTQILGGGPYRIKEHDAEREVWERVADWWGNDVFGVPHIPYVVGISVPNDLLNNQAFEAGETDLGGAGGLAIWELIAKGLDRGAYYDHPPYMIEQTPWCLFFSYGFPPFANIDIRRALAFGFPSGDVLKLFYQIPNYTFPQPNPVPIVPSSAAGKYINQTLVNEIGWYENVTKANQILDNAGIVDTNHDGFREWNGTELKDISIQWPIEWNPPGVLNVIAEGYLRIGIGFKVDYVPAATWIFNFLITKNFKATIMLAGTYIGLDNPWNGFRACMDPRLLYIPGFGDNTKYTNTSVIPLLDAACVESDPQKLMTIYSQIEEMWLRDVIGIPIAYAQVGYAFSNDYWVGWPTENNGFWHAGWLGGFPPLGGMGFPNQLPNLFTVVPKGQTPVQPAWVTDWKFTTDQIYAGISAAVLRKPDINDDGRVDMKDLGLVARHFGETPSRPTWDYRCDINLDDKVDMKDIGTIAKKFGTIV